MWAGTASSSSACSGFGFLSWLFRLFFVKGMGEEEESLLDIF